MIKHGTNINQNLIKFGLDLSISWSDHTYFFYKYNLGQHIPIFLWFETVNTNIINTFKHFQFYSHYNKVYFRKLQSLLCKYYFVILTCT